MTNDTKPWHESIDLLRPYIFRIATPRCTGTGFLVATSRNSAVYVVATAAHVVDQAHYWEEPVRLTHESSGASHLLRHRDRAIFLDEDRDTAAIFFSGGDLQPPTAMLPLSPKGLFYKVGNDIGWLGFPALPGADLCFFGGKVSSILEAQEAYLVDGVAINGVSGGPAFHPTAEQPMIMGVVSAYMPNRATGATLPGLAVVRSVRTFHDLAPQFDTVEQAKSQETPPTSPTLAEKPAGSEEVSRRSRDC